MDSLRFHPSLDRGEHLPMKIPHYFCFFSITEPLNFNDFGKEMKGRGVGGRWGLRR